MTFKKILTFVVLLTLITKAFSETDEERIKAMFWKSNDPDFAVKKCDDKWKNESAVILCKKYEYSVQKEVIVKVVYEKIYTHVRILLNDKAAVNEFSTFSFDVSENLHSWTRWDRHKIFVGIKIIKPDGREMEVPVDKNLIDKIKTRDKEEKTQKIAIPNLEPGDIVDYYYASELSENISNNSFNPFSPVIYYLVDKYPIVKQKLEMHIMRKCYLNARSMNGAPEFILDGDSQRKDMVYSITDSDRYKTRDQLWRYKIRSLPVVLFQAYYINNPYIKNMYVFFDKEGIIKKSVSDDELVEFYNKTIKTHTVLYQAKEINKYLKKNFKKGTDPLVLAKEAYNFFRQENFGYDLTGSWIFGTGLSEPFSSLEFVVNMSYVFKKWKINHDIIITVPRNLGSMNDLISPGMMDFLIRVKGETPLYLSNYTKYSLSSELDPSFQGNEAKAVDVLSKKKATTNIAIPIMDKSQNKEISDIEVKFNPEESEKLTITKKISACGLEKWKNSSDIVTKGDYFDVCMKKKFGPDYMNKKNLKKHNKSFFESFDPEVKKRDEYLVRSLKDEMDVSSVKVSKFELIQSGILDTAPVLKYNIHFEINKYITKAGNNIILEAGKLIGSQVTLDPSDSLRAYDIYMPYARTYENQIYVEIPQGYTVKGTNNLTFNVTNETGGFVSSAKVEGNKLVINTSKYFTNNYFAKESWPSIRRFLTAANDFQNQKVMFVPGK